LGWNQTFLAGALVMFLAGIGIPVMAALNAGLGKGLDSPVAATAVLYAIGFALALAAVTVAGMPDWSRFGAISMQNYTGAFFVVFYILAITYFAPRIGVGNAVFFVLIGQLVATAAIDHYGLLGSLRFPFTPKRALGIALMAAGVWLAKKPV
jgi:bacterial/archaeal transporter family-2 protein